MAKPTERAIKRKPLAVVMLTTYRKNIPDGGGVPEVPNDGRDFEWFQNQAAMEEFFDQVHLFHEEDTKEHDDMAYLTAEVTDTSAMTLGRVRAAPENDEWVDAVMKDASLLLTVVTPKSDTGTKKAVKPRKKSTAARAVKKAEVPEAKAARLKQRLAEKKGEAEQAKPAAKKAATKKETATT